MFETKTVRAEFVIKKFGFKVSSIVKFTFISIVKGCAYLILWFFDNFCTLFSKRNDYVYNTSIEAVMIFKICFRFFKPESIILASVYYFLSNFLLFYDLVFDLKFVSLKS